MERNYCRRREGDNMFCETLSLERDGNVAMITMNRPPANRLNVKSYEDLNTVFTELSKDETVGAIVLTGAGEESFAAGLDVKEVVGNSVAWINNLGKNVLMTMETIANIDKPTVAALFGFIIGGGCELALVCDLRIAADNTMFAFPEVPAGVIPGSGGTQRLPRLIGMARAKEMIFIGEPVAADEAYRIGFVNRVVPRNSLMEESINLAKKLAARPRIAIGLAKKAINSAMNTNLPTGLCLESDCFTIAYASEDGREGLQAIVEERKPKYTGR